MLFESIVSLLLIKTGKKISQLEMSETARLMWYSKYQIKFMFNDSHHAKMCDRTTDSQTMVAFYFLVCFDFSTLLASVVPASCAYLPNAFDR